MENWPIYLKNLTVDHILEQQSSSKIIAFIAQSQLYQGSKSNNVFFYNDSFSKCLCLCLMIRENLDCWWLVHRPSRALQQLLLSPPWSPIETPNIAAHQIATKYLCQSFFSHFPSYSTFLARSRYFGLLFPLQYPFFVFCCESIFYHRHLPDSWILIRKSMSDESNITH